MSELSYREIRIEICKLMKSMRVKAGLSQAELAERMEVSRFTVIRLEGGKQELKRDYAEKIEAATERTGLAALVDARDRALEQRRGTPARNQVVLEMLEKPGVHRIEVSLVDDLDLVGLIHESKILARSPSLNIRVVMPTVGREAQLFGGGKLLKSHLDNQLKHLSDIMDVDRDSENIQIFESQTIIQPAMVVRSAQGDACATWPVLPVGGKVKGSSVPVSMAEDPAIVEEVARHIAGIRDPDPKIDEQPNAMRVYLSGMIGTVEDDDGKPHVKFNGYVPHGDREGDPRHPSVGSLASLVLLYGVMTREGFPPKTRFLVYKREEEPQDKGRLSLLSTRVDDRDLVQAHSSGEQANGAGEASVWRSNLDAHAASIEHSKYFKLKDPEDPSVELEDFTVSDSVFEKAALREIRATFNVDEESEKKPEARLEDLGPLPPDLRLVEKSGGDRSIIPRLYAYELTTREVEEIQNLERPTFSELGYKDLPGDGNDESIEADKLNHFLQKASADGWLPAQLKEKLGVAEK